jgi:hypothetical protein
MEIVEPVDAYLQGHNPRPIARASDPAGRDHRGEGRGASRGDGGQAGHAGNPSSRPAAID